MLIVSDEVSRALSAAYYSLVVDLLPDKFLKHILKRDDT